MIPIEVIRHRLNSFWGYGSFEAPVWFIGMEEGLSGSTDQKQIDIRFQATHGKVLANIRQDMKLVNGHMKWFTLPYPIQGTIRYPIALYLYLANSRRPDKDEIRYFQGLRFADISLKETAALELMPMPSNSTDPSAWLYRDYAIQGLRLRTRAEYQDFYKPLRVRELRNLVDKYHPQIVIFYSVTLLRDWQAVAGIGFDEITRQMYFGKRKGTSFCVIPQGNARGMSNDRLFQYADLIKPRLNLTELGRCVSEKRFQSRPADIRLRPLGR